MGPCNRQRQRRHQQPSRVLVKGCIRPNPADPSELLGGNAALSDDTFKASSTSAAASPPFSTRTFRVDGLVALTTALKAAAFLVASCYLFGGALLVCVVTIGSFYVLLEVSTTATHDNPGAMWTISQMEVYSALSFDSYLRFLVTKLAVVWRSIFAIHKSAVNYSFSVSISETPSVAELQDLLERQPRALLTYEKYVPTKYDDDRRSRGSSLASTVIAEDAFIGEDARLSIASDSDSEESEHDVTDEVLAEVIEDLLPEDQLYTPNKPLPVVRELPPIVKEYFAIEDDECTSVSEAEEEPSLESESEDDIEEDKQEEIQHEVVEPVKQTEDEPSTDARIAALSSFIVPMLPILAELSSSKNQSVAQAPSPLEPVVVPQVKPLIRDVQPVKWYEPAPIQAPVVVVRPAPSKRRISVSMMPVKPLPRLVFKPRPSKPQTMQQMLAEAEKMMREVRELLAIGNAVLSSTEEEENTQEELAEDEGELHDTRHVRFSDDLDIIGTSCTVDDFSDDEGELENEDEGGRGSILFYCADEIESMSNEFFSSFEEESIAAC